jgi:DNA (cytosine-5)-methyltransferase 1
MRYLSICSGIEAATVAWHPLGWTAAALSEIEAFPRAVLAHHYPETPLHGDFTTIGADEYGPIDLLVGGTPCQSFSVAGLRGGLADERGNLALEYLRLADRARPRWLVWENVPGVLSSNGGKDFGTFLGGLAELGYGFAYRVLDAQHFGVPQRRRRVFVVGYLGDWRRAAAVLFERHSLSGNPAPRREKGQAVAGSLTSRASGGGGGPGAGTDEAAAGYLQAVAFGSKEYAQDAGDVSPPLRAMGSRKDHPNGGGQIAIAYQTSGNCGAWETGRITGALDTNTDPNSTVITIQERAVSENPDTGPDGAGFRTDGQAYTLEARTVPQAVAFMENIRAEVRTSHATDALTKGGGKPGQGYAAAMVGSQVRRLTPRECERLQGFPDDYTLIPYRGKPAADGPRYKALGNSMAVPVMRFIGERIAAVDALQSERLAA